MNHRNATYVKTHFGECIASAIKEPLIIENHGKKNAVILSYEEFLQFQAYEDYYWGETAKQALSESKFLSEQESLNYLHGKLNAKD